MKRLFLGSVAFLACLMPAVASHAQSTEPVEKPLSIKVGAFFPTNSNAKDVAGNTQFTAGIDYAFVKTTQNNPTLPSIYFDYMGGSKNGARDQNFGLGVAVRTLTNTPGKGFSPYVGAGIGAYEEDIKNLAGVSTNKVGFGGKIMLGAEIGQGPFVEANYNFLPSRVGVNPSGFGVDIGTRF